MLQNVCKCKVDKYVEFDFIVIFIDLLLLKVSAYRHVLYNLPNFNKVQSYTYLYNCFSKTAIITNTFESLRSL